MNILESMDGYKFAVAVPYGNGRSISHLIDLSTYDDFTDFYYSVKRTVGLDNFSASNRRTRKLQITGWSRELPDEICADRHLSANFLFEVYAHYQGIKYENPYKRADTTRPV